MGSLFVPTVRKDATHGPSTEEKKKRKKESKGKAKARQSKGRQITALLI